jgi:putative membrane protein
MKLILHWIFVAVALFIAAYIVPGIYAESFTAALIVAAVLGVVTILIKPILFILTLPINILTLGLFTFVINALLLAFAASLVEGFSVQGFVPALIGALIVSVINGIFHVIARD